MSRLNFKHLQYFWAVAHEGHLTRAAERLAVSQSALSTQIRLLEERLGHPLFDRRGKSLALTEAGRIVLDHADTIFAAGEALLDALSDDRAPSVQTLHVGALATLSRNFQLGFLGPALRRDDVRLVIRSGQLDDLLSALQDFRLDVVLTNAPPGRDAAAPWIAHRLAEQPVSLIGGDAAAAVDDPPETLLAEQPLIAPTADSGVRASLDAFLDRHEVRPRIVAEVDDMAMIRLLAREGAGLAIAPPIVFKDELERGDLREVARLPGITETFWAVTRERRFPSALARNLIDAATRQVPAP